MRVEEPTLGTRGTIVQYYSMNTVGHPRGSYTEIQIDVRLVARPKRKSSSALSSTRKNVGTRCRSPSNERFLDGRISPFMGITEHFMGLRAWCKQCPPGGKIPDVFRPGRIGLPSCEHEYAQTEYLLMPLEPPYQTATHPPTDQSTTYIIT